MAGNMKLLPFFFDLSTVPIKKGNGAAAPLPVNFLKTCKVLPVGVHQDNFNLDGQTWLDSRSTV